MLNSSPRFLTGFVVALVSLGIFQKVTHAEDWPQWRGPRGNSTSLDSDLPVAWSAEAGIVWKTPLPEWGSSTPAIWGDAVFVTTQSEDDLLVLKINRQNGAIEWTQKVGQASTPRSGPKREKQKFHQLHNLASPSPVTAEVRIASAWR